MKLQLVLADHCDTCVETESVWRQACAQLNLEFEVLLTVDGKGRRVADQLNLRTFPALVADGRIRAIGAPTAETAQETLLNLLQADADAARPHAPNNS